MRSCGRLVGLALTVAVWGGAFIAAAGLPRTAGASEIASSTPAAAAVAAEPISAASAKSAPASITWSREQEDHPWIRWGGRWSVQSGSEPSGGSSMISRTKGAWSAATFTGTSAAVVSRVGPDRGHMRVYVDGVGVATVSLCATSSANGVVVWSTTGLRAGTHTVKVVALGSKDPSSSDAWVEVDAFDIGGALRAPGAYPGKRVQNGDPRLSRKGSWATIKRTSAFGKSVARTDRSGASVTVRFKGTGVTWFGRKDSTSGNAEVWLDGVKVAAVGQYSDSTLEPRVIWTASALKNKVHSVTIKNVGATVPGGGTRMELDAFQVQGTVLTAPRPTPFTYPWRTYIVIDKSSFKLYWVKDKVLVKVYPIAHGKAHTPTPEKVWRIDKKYRTSPGSVYGPRKMRLFKRVKSSRGDRYVFTAYGVHGTNQEWVIGTRASHGCIRMYNKDVRELFPQVPIGTMVVTRN